MPKITNKRKLKWCLQHYDTQEIANNEAKQLSILEDFNKSTNNTNWQEKYQL